MRDSELMEVYRSINRVHTREEAMFVDALTIAEMKIRWPDHDCRIDWKRVPVGRRFLFRPTGILAECSKEMEDERKGA